jgi:hypothetical protein
LPQASRKLAFGASVTGGGRERKGQESSCPSRTAREGNHSALSLVAPAPYRSATRFGMKVSYAPPAVRAIQVRSYSLVRAPQR